MIDYDLIKRMRACRDICELGHRVRADYKIRNRQPLSRAYVIFSDPTVQAYMIYIDCGKEEYAGIIADELNVHEVIFVEGENASDKFFDYSLSANFRSMGPAGRGREAGVLKKAFDSKEPGSLTGLEKNTTYLRLQAGETVDIRGVATTLADVEVKFVSKGNYASASGKSGAVVLDTKMTEQLKDLGFIAEFRSVVQNQRRALGLSVQDRIDLSIESDDAYTVETLNRYTENFRTSLLATTVFINCNECDTEIKALDKKIKIKILKL